MYRRGTLELGQLGLERVFGEIPRKGAPASKGLGTIAFALIRSPGALRAKHRGCG